MMRPEIRQRIKTLVAEPEEAVKVGITTELHVLRNRAASEGHDPEVRAEVALRLQLLMAHAKLAGMIVDRKQVQKRSVSFTAAVGSKDELNKLLADQLQQLSPGGRRKLELIAAGVDDETIEAQ